MICEESITSAEMSGVERVKRRQEENKGEWQDEEENKGKD